MLLPSPAVDFVQGKIFIDGDEAGWSETFNFSSSFTMTAARTRLGTIINARSRLLAKNHAILRGTCSQMSVLRDGRSPTGLTSAMYLPRLIGSEMTNPEVTDF